MLKRCLTLLPNVYGAGLCLVLGLRLAGVEIWWLALLNTFAPYLFLPLLIALPLAALLRAKKTAAGALLLTVIGFVWFIAPVIIPKTIAGPDGLTLKVVTFNILGKPRSLKPELDWLLSTNADVIVLEEVVAEGADPRLAPLKARYPYEAYINGSVRIFSRYPYIEKQWVMIEEKPGRLALRVVLDVRGQNVAIYAVHFSLPAKNTPHLKLPLYRFPFNFILYYDETRRNAQIRRLLDIVAHEPNPYLVAGDFNTSAYSPIYGEMAQVMTDSFAEAGRGFGHTWAVSRVIGAPEFVPPLLRIDYIWHSSHWYAVAAETGPALNSDHLPVMATLVLSP